MYWRYVAWVALVVGVAHVGHLHYCLEPASVLFILQSHLCHCVFAHCFLLDFMCPGFCTIFSRMQHQLIIFSAASNDVINTLYKIH